MWAFDRGLAPPGYHPSSLRDWIELRVQGGHGSEDSTDSASGPTRAGFPFRGAAFA
jgi:hypothetical protein